MMSDLKPYFGKVKKKSNRQKAWDYMRRNRCFRIGDILVVLEISEGSLKSLVRQLSQAQYLVKSKSVQKFKDKEFRLVKNTGVVCPSVITGTKFLYDSNTFKKVFMGKGDG